MKTFNFFKLILSLSLLSAPLVQAHEGHGEIPGSLKAVHGGITKAGKLFNLEMLASDTDIQLFPAAHPGEKLDMKKMKMTGNLKSPKGKTQPLSFTATEKSFNTKIDFLGGHRVSLEIKAEYEGKVDSFQFLVEK